MSATAKLFSNRIAQLGPKFVFGVPQVYKPIVPAPEGRFKVKFRQDKFARLFEQQPDGVSECVLMDIGNRWERSHATARNVSA